MTFRRCKSAISLKHAMHNLVLQTRILANESKRVRHIVQNVKLSTFYWITQTSGKILFGFEQVECVITVTVPNWWSHFPGMKLWGVIAHG